MELNREELREKYFKYLYKNMKLEQKGGQLGGCGCSSDKDKPISLCSKHSEELFGNNLTREEAKNGFYKYAYKTLKL